MAANLQYTVKEAHNDEAIRILDLVGDIDETNQADLEQLLDTFLQDEKVEYVVINLQQLEYINSGVIGILAAIHSNFAENDKEFVFAAANSHIFDIIDLVGLTTVITLFETVEEACVAFED